MKKITTSLIYLVGLLCNAALFLVGFRILQAGYFSGRAGHIASGSEANIFGILFIGLGLGGAIMLLIAYARYLISTRRSHNAEGQAPR